jgi:glycosyltransferase involved in cell wall biosynthesis
MAYKGTTSGTGRNPRVKILVLVPAYNEEASIGAVVGGIREHLPEADILVVNDCSTDDTLQVLRVIGGIRILNLPFNMGIGAAVLSGFNYFLRHGYDALVRLDGDGQHPSSMAGGLLKPVLDDTLDVTIGSRYLGRETAYSSFSRKVGIKFLNLLTNMILRRTMTDSTSGFRAYNRRAIEYLAADYPFDYPEPEEVYLLSQSGFRIGEIPVVMKAREQGVSSISAIRTVYYLVKIIITIFVKYAIGGMRR